MSDHGTLVPLRRAPARRAGSPLALRARRGLHDPRVTAVVAAAVALGAERGLRHLATRTTGLSIRRRRPAHAMDGRISVEWVAYAVRLIGRAPLR